MKKQILILAALLAVSPCAWGSDDEDEKEDWVVDTSGIGKSHHGVIRNDQILEMGVPTASALQLEGESSLRMGQLDRALVALQRAIELAPLDADKRLLYAECLERKMISQKQKERDPRLYNFLVKQWLFVYSKADFPDQKAQALTHLGTLTGTAPKMWERPHKFLARVLIPEDGSKPVVIGGHGRSARKIANAKGDRDRDESFLKD